MYCEFKKEESDCTAKFCRNKCLYVKIKESKPKPLTTFEKVKQGMVCYDGQYKCYSFFCIDRGACLKQVNPMNQAVLRSPDEQKTLPKFRGNKSNSNFTPIGAGVKKRMGVNRNVSPTKRAMIYKRDNYTCLKCGDPTNAITIDHIVPLSRGGSNDYKNLQTLCMSCNYEKKNEIIDYRTIKD